MSSAYIWYLCHGGLSRSPAAQMLERHLRQTALQFLAHDVKSGPSCSVQS